MRDLSKTAVFLDFDGTISVRDIGVHILDRLADPGWRELDVAYAAGTIGSRECMAQQWSHIPSHVTEDERRAAAREVPLDPGFGPLVAALRDAGAEIAVVSDGYGYYAHELLAEWALPIFANGVDFATNEVVFPHADQRCAPCGACGTCKPAVLEAAHARGLRSVFIGDGTSDRHAARMAHEVFAKGALAQWCRDEAIAHTSFAHLEEVTTAIFGRQ